MTYGYQPCVECEVCGRHHAYLLGGQSRTYHETDLTNGECINHCPECDPLSIRPGSRKAER